MFEGHEVSEQDVVKKGEELLRLELVAFFEGRFQRRCPSRGAVAPVVCSRALGVHRAGSEPVDSWSFFTCEFWALMGLENNLQLSSGISSGLQKVGGGASGSGVGGCLGSVGAPFQEGEGVGVPDDHALTAWDRRSWAIIP